jgi:hypothetical protein
MGSVRRWVTRLNRLSREIDRLPQRNEPDHKTHARYDDTHHAGRTPHPKESAMTLQRRRLWSTLTVAAASFAAIVFQLHAMKVHAQDAMATNGDETQRTEASVMAVDRHWSIAELTGDTDWLNQMLLPEYRSVNTDGTAHSKEAIVAGAMKRKGTDLAKARDQFATYQKEHPYGSAVIVHDNTAIVSFYDPALGPQKGVKSSDIFVYLDGHWHAMYSQHTSLHS